MSFTAGRDQSHAIDRTHWDARHAGLASAASGLFRRR